MIRAQGLTKRFGTQLAVDAVDLEVEPGSVFGLLGPNGAGKTTTLRMLATLLKPDAGEAQIAGHDLRRDGEAVRRAIGVVNGGMGLYDRLTGRETLRWFADLYDQKPAQATARIEELNELLDLRETLDRRCSEFSTGMRQKIVIARAVIHDPPVLFFDEAASGLDVMARRSLLDFARSSAGRERAVVWSTHVMSEVEELCDRVAIQVAGRLLDVGSVAELRHRADDAPDLETAFFRSVRAAGLQGQVTA